MNLHEKLLEIQKAVSYLKKENQGFQYRYVSSSQTLSGIRAEMDRLGVLLIPRITRSAIKEYLSKKEGNLFLTELDFTFTWINVENPQETLMCEWYAQGSDSGERGVGKSATYAEKFFLLKFFHIATDQDDPDAFQARRTEAGKKIKPPAAPLQMAPMPMDERPGYMADGREAPPNPWSGKLVSISEPIPWGVDRFYWEVETNSEVLGLLTTFDKGIAECAQAALVDHSTVQIQWKLGKSKKTGKTFKTAEGMAILDG